MNLEANWALESCATLPVAGLAQGLLKRTSHVKGARAGLGGRFGWNFAGHKLAAARPGDAGSIALGGGGGQALR